MADGDLDDERETQGQSGGRVRTNVVLFLATVVSVFLTGAMYDLRGAQPPDGLLGLLHPHFLATGWPFAVPLLAILLTHEFGHYFAARYHGVPASLPYFIPMPFVSPFGTMGAVISMQGRIRSRAALLDIGASGPLAGMIVALPVLAWGVAHSKVAPSPDGPYWQEGQSILYWLLKLVIHGPIPAGSDVNLHATAFAGWVGLFVTMLNLIPYGQLDGGHIAYALFGRKQDGYAVWVRRSLLALLAYNLAVFFGPIALGASTLPIGAAIGNSLTWLVWYGLLRLLTYLGGREHPPFEPGPLSRGRRVIAWLCLILFVLIFMPTPLAQMG
jgi:membrane-associated protease RseP (regulator of RpoE activity)